jgi:hypothetical protein
MIRNFIADCLGVASIVLIFCTMWFVTANAASLAQMIRSATNILN